MSSGLHVLDGPSTPPDWRAVQLPPIDTAHQPAVWPAGQRSGFGASTTRADSTEPFFLKSLSKCRVAFSFTPGARAQAALMPVWRTCWQQGRSAVDFLSQLLRGPAVASLRAFRPPPLANLCGGHAEIS